MLSGKIIAVVLNKELSRVDVDGVPNVKLLQRHGGISHSLQKRFLVLQIELHSK